jgi:hypothetical protein
MASAANRTRGVGFVFNLDIFTLHAKDS